MAPDPFEVYPVRGGCRWRLTSPNGRIVAAASETFATPSSAKRNAVLTCKMLAESLGVALPRS